MNGWNAPPPRGVSAAPRQAPLAARQLNGDLSVMRSSLYPCGTRVDARNPVDYSYLKWTDVFARSTTYALTYNVSDMRYWLDIVGLVQFLGLPTYEYATGCPPAGDPAGVEYYYPLLDGGIAYHDFWRLRNGKFRDMRNGKQVIGSNCVRYFCYELGLKQPRRRRGENKIPSHQSLKEEIKDQQSDMAVGVFLELRIEEFRERFRI